MHRYISGGLDTQPDDREEIFSVDGVNYLLTEKLKSKLRESIIDWKTFQEIYNMKDDAAMFSNIARILDIKETENMPDILKGIMEKLYEMPNIIHIRAMIKQYAVYEPISIAIRELFNTLKKHYEHLVKTFLTERNRYILKNNLKNNHHKAKMNDVEKLLRKWNDYNTRHKLESSSVILLFINKPGTHIHYDIGDENEEKNKVISQLVTAVSLWKYPGFCPKVPQKRLSELLKFPADAFYRAISVFNGNAVFPDQRKIIEKISEVLRDAVEKPEVKDEVKREPPPDDATVQWYVDKILELRESLLDKGKEFEVYYIKEARRITQLTAILQELLIP